MLGDVLAKYPMLPQAVQTTQRDCKLCQKFAANYHKVAGGTTQS
jgi:hypothetical protein